MRAETLLLLLAALLLAATGTAAAADNTAPLADAGVDQTVPVNSTVYLDANGSTDPDGDIESVAWAVETPSGDTISPDCDDCRRTEFDAAVVGQYTVTLTVTDDDGATRSDTLYVTATTERGPDISLSGPSSTAPGSNATFTANVSSDNASLQTLTWLVNGNVVERESLDGASTIASFRHSFDSTGDATVRAVVYDTLGERGSATRRVSVGSGGGGGGSGECFATWCGEGGADASYTGPDGETTIVDTNGKEGIQTYDDEGQLITIQNPDENPNVERGLNNEWRIEGGLGSLSDDTFANKNDGGDRSSGNSESSSSSDGSSFIGGSVKDAVDNAKDTINNLLGGSSDSSSRSDDSGGDDDSGGGGFSDGGGGLGGLSL